jgi:lysyl-tRNA synthetase class 2
MDNEQEARLQRLNYIEDTGLNAYPSSAGRTHTLQQFLDTYEQEESAVVCGRILMLRKHGGLAFIRLRDASGELQIVLRKDTLGEETYDQFFEITDLGDFFEFTGGPFTTKKGEHSLEAQKYKLLTKSLEPLPDKYHGLNDTEKRYRQRYLDLIANKESMDIAVKRAEIVSIIREEFEGAGYLEVETPVLQPIAGGTTAKPFVTHHEALHHDFFLRIAPELYLKRLLVGGMERIYEYSKCYRNEGISPQHNPEFTQIEAYAAYQEIEDLMEFLEQMLNRIAVRVVGSESVTYGDDTLTFAKELPRLTFRQAVIDHAGIDIDEHRTEDSLVEAIKSKGMEVEGIGYAEIVDNLYKKTARPKIIQPTFVTDYPADMKPLAKKREDSFYSASAQLVVNGMELWNAFNEQNDPRVQRADFEAQEALRERGNDEAQRIDEDFLTALSHGMPPAAGQGLGIDRLVMILTNSPNLKEVILFPTLKPKAE